MIERYRKEIDRIDSKILGLFEERMVFSKKIGNYKREKGKLISDLNREKKIILGLTNKTKLDKKFIKEIYRVIFKFSKKVQK